ncbi:MAG: hypothetical protein L0Y72_32030 [Gemmataceae bacterium]|nr:hypothetical protein [Gemmataceae bacterium]MCI0743684.1 hypothetical protein [Gemmataceae bacterium]
MALRTAEQTTLENEFRTLAERWKEACALLSSTSAMIAHPAYQSIIELGQPAVPLLLRELKKEPVHWFEALKAITGEDPVKPSDWGNISGMASAWLDWGRSRNLV